MKQHVSSIPEEYTKTVYGVMWIERPGYDPMDDFIHSPDEERVTFGEEVFPLENDPIGDWSCVGFTQEAISILGWQVNFNTLDPKSPYRFWAITKEGNSLYCVFYWEEGKRTTYWRAQPISSEQAKQLEEWVRKEVKEAITPCRTSETPCRTRVTPDTPTFACPMHPEFYAWCEQCDNNKTSCGTKVETVTTKLHIAWAHCSSHDSWTHGCVYCDEFPTVYPGPVEFQHPCITLGNGWRVVNFSSNHSFLFDTGEVLAACDERVTRTLKLDMKEEAINNPKGFEDIRVFYFLNDSVREALLQLADDSRVDIILVPLPVAQAVVARRGAVKYPPKQISSLSVGRLKEGGELDYILSKIRVCRVVDRISKKISSSKFCLP